MCKSLPNWAHRHALRMNLPDGLGARKSRMGTNNTDSIAPEWSGVPPDEAQETLQAIRDGEVDAVVVHHGEAPAVYLLKDPDRLHRVIVERMSEGAVILSNDGTILYGNSSFAEFVGLDKALLPSRPLDSLVAPEHQRRLAASLTLAQTAPAEVEVELVGRQGLLPVYISASPIDLEDWKSCIVLVVTDLTKRRRSEHLAAAAEFARSVFDQASEAIVVCDLDGIVTHASLAAQALCVESPVGRGFAEAFPLHRSGAGDDPVAKDFPTGGNQDGVELEMTCRGGQRRHFIGREGPLKASDGATLGRIVTLADITDRKAAERILAEEREARNAILRQEVMQRTAELQAANSQLEGFIYAASHDMRGSLGRINSFSVLLEKNYRSRLDGDGILFLDLIRQNASRLATLVDDLLHHFRIEKREACLQPADLPATLQVVLHEKADDIREIGTTVRCDVPAVQVLADPYGLAQVLRNLIENALKYSSRAVEPLVEIGGEEHDGRFRLWVRDNGIGFDMAYHDKIFEIFRRLHSYAEFPGNGVGLALVKRAMERMGGSVRARSEPGKGAVFELEFMVAQETAAALPPGQDAAGNSA